MVVLKKDNAIWISRGDTAQIDIHFGYDVPPDGTVCVMSLKEYTSREAVIWEKEVAVENGLVSFVIATNDTNNLGFGDYKWDLRLYYIDGTVLTPFKPAIFKIIEVVGNIKASGDSAVPLRAQHMDISIHDQTNEIEVVVTGGTRLDVIEVTYADKAAQLETARKIELVGDVTGSIDFDGSEDVQLESQITEITNEDIEEMFA